MPRENFKIVKQACSPCQSFEVHTDGVQCGAPFNDGPSSPLYKGSTFAVVFLENTSTGMTTDRNERPRRNLNKRWDEEQFLFDKDPEGFQARFINEEKGFGLFATRQFLKGDFLLFYRGKRLSAAQNEQLLQEDKFEYVFSDSSCREMFIDASDANSGLGRFMNDAADVEKPNVKAELYRDRTGLPHVRFVALRDVQIDDELLYNYNGVGLVWRTRKLKVLDVNDVSRNESSSEENQKENQAPIEEKSEKQRRVQVAQEKLVAYNELEEEEETIRLYTDVKNSCQVPKAVLDLPSVDQQLKERSIPTIPFPYFSDESDESEILSVIEELSEVTEKLSDFERDVAVSGLQPNEKHWEAYKKEGAYAPKVLDDSYELLERQRRLKKSARESNKKRAAKPGVIFTSSTEIVALESESEEYPIDVQQLSECEWDQTMKSQVPLILPQMGPIEKSKKKMKDTDFLPSDAESRTSTTTTASSSSEQQDEAQKQKISRKLKRSKQDEQRISSNSSEEGEKEQEKQTRQNTSQRISNARKIPKSSSVECKNTRTIEQNWKKQVVHCFICHKGITKNNILRHMQLNHKHLSNDKLKNLAAKLTFKFNSKSKKYICLREDCLAIVARRRTHEHPNDMILIRKRGDIPLAVSQKLFPVTLTEAQNKFLPVAHIADFPKLLEQYKENRRRLYEIGAEKYSDKALLPSIKKLEKLILMSKGLTDLSVYPDFLASLERVVAPKSMRNVTDWVIDFAQFLLEKFGNDGPNQKRLLKPESIKSTLTTYRKTFNRPAKERQKTQTWVDFCNMPTVNQFREVKSKILVYVDGLLKKGRRNDGLVVIEYGRLMKSLVCLVVFRNACRIGSSVYIMHEHFIQLKRNSAEEDYSMPLAPAKLRHTAKKGESKSQAIERVQKQIKKANKNYHKEGKKVLFFTSFEKQIFDQFVNLKDKMNGVANAQEDFLFHPYLEREVNPDYESLKNFDRDVGRVLKISHSFNCTQYRKRMQTTWAQQIRDPEQMKAVDEHLGHSWKTGLQYYTNINQEKSGQIVSNLVTEHMTVPIETKDLSSSLDVRNSTAENSERGKDVQQLGRSISTAEKYVNPICLQPAPMTQSEAEETSDEEEDSEASEDGMIAECANKFDAIPEVSRQEEISESQQGEPKDGVDQRRYEIAAAARSLLEKKRSQRKRGSSEIPDIMIEEIVTCFILEITGRSFNLSELHKRMFAEHKYEKLRTQLNYLRQWKKNGFKAEE